MTRSLALKNASLIAGTFLLVISVAAHAAPDKKDKAQGRLLYGKVLDQQDNPVAGAIVYLTNSRTHAVKSYVSQFDDRPQVYIDLRIDAVKIDAR